MEPAPLPPQPQVSNLRRYWPVTLAGLAVVGFTVALLLSFTDGSDSTDSAGVISLDPNATSEFNGIENGTDPTGQKIGDLSYVTFDGATESLVPNGKPLLLNFWSSTCTPCVREMPALDQVWRDNAGSIDVLGLDYYETPDVGRAMADRTGVTYPLGRDTKGRLLRTFGGIGLPYTVLIAQDGTVLAVHAGALDAAGFQDLVDTAVGN